MNDATVHSADNFLKNFLNSTLKDLMAVVGAECGSLFLFDYQSNELVLDAFHNSASLRLGGLRQKIGQGISGKVIDIRVPILVKDIDSDTRFRRNGFNHYKTKSFISLPLFTSRGIIVGLINLADKSSGECFSEKDLEVAISLSRYACIIVDHFLYSAQLEHEQEKLHKQKSFLEKYASVGKLAAGIVHEINNPLDGIIRYTNILLAQIEDNSIGREYLLEVRKGLNRIAGITRSLLEFSHQVNSASSQVKKYVDVHKLIDDSLDLLSNKLNANIQIARNYKDNLPKILDLGLAQVVVNMIKNALDAIASGGRLEIATGIEDSVVKISFKDTGSGITDEIKDRIFEPFFTTKSMDKGTGLGLAICHEIIHRYDGKIEWESTLGKGSTFTVLIPKKHLEHA